MAAVKLEILRDGPPHNHLLSPLTSYLALCGDHNSTTMHVPFEHAQLLERLRALAYHTEGEEQERRRVHELSEMGRSMGSILEQVPGLVKDMADAARRDGEVTHLRLVLSSNELALLPFELATGPAAFPGTGDPLCLQSVSPVCVTREIRRVAPPPVTWPRRPKVLLVSASPEGTAPVPLDAHLLALRHAVDPWVHHAHSSKNGRSLLSSVSSMLSVLPDANVESIAEACATGEYTHVHILAHGVPMTQGDDRHFGIALHDRLDPKRMDPVDGTRLGTALRSHLKEGDRQLARPTVVTLASCDSGNVGTTVAPGSSIAHDLHRAGIPLVVASQFPLSFEGSVHLVRFLYEALLWGQDPRLVLNDVRRQLAALVRKRHDWASLVVYAALPPDLEYQLKDVTFEQARRAIEATMSHLDAMLDEMSKELRDIDEKEILALRTKLERAERKLQHLRSKAPERAADIDGLLASAEKRMAEFWFRRAKSAEKAAAAAAGDGAMTVGSSSQPGAPVLANKSDYEDRAERCLRTAEQHYEDAFGAVGFSWSLVQAMALFAARTGRVDGEAWQLAWLLSKREEELYPKSDERHIFALNNMVELAVLALLSPKETEAEAGSDPCGPRGSIRLEQPEVVAKDLLHQLLGLRMRDQGPVRSLRRQLMRYQETFPKVSSDIRALAKSLLGLIGSE